MNPCLRTSHTNSKSRYARDQHATLLIDYQYVSYAQSMAAKAGPWSPPAVVQTLFEACCAWRCTGKCDTHNTVSAITSAQTVGSEATSAVRVARTAREGKHRPSKQGRTPKGTESTGGGSWCHYEPHAVRLCGAVRAWVTTTSEIKIDAAKANSCAPNAWTGTREGPAVARAAKDEMGE